MGLQDIAANRGTKGLDADCGTSLACPDRATGATCPPSATRIVTMIQRQEEALHIAPGGKAVSCDGVGIRGILRAPGTGAMA